MSKTLQVPSPSSAERISLLIHLIPSAALGAGLVLTVSCAMGLARNLHAPALFLGGIAGAAVGSFVASAWSKRS